MTPLAGKTAICIEDGQESGNVLEQNLIQLGISVQVILDSADIENELDSHSAPDVIFLDLETSHMNGYAVLEFILQNTKFAHVPVVACTSHMSHLSDAKQAGFHSFLGKPLNEGSFPTQIASILAGESVWEGNS